MFRILIILIILTSCTKKEVKYKQEFDDELIVNENLDEFVKTNETINW